YFEYGLLDRLTLFGNFQFLSSNRQLNPGGDISYSSNNVGDLLLGTRFNLIQNPFVFSLEARITVPTGDQNAVIPTGTGDLRTELRLVFAKGFEPIVPLILEGEIGY